MWAAWTERERMAAWWGPNGMTLGVAAWDLRPGGVFHYWLEAPAGGKMWGRFVFREIAAPERLVFVSSFSDENGGLIRHPMSATWPLEVFNVLTLTERDGRTTLTLRGGPINASEIERQTFQENRGNLRQGFAGTWSQLDAYLAGG